MHQYKIVAQISLILSIPNLVLAAPMVVQEVHEACGGEAAVAEDVVAMPKKSDELEVESDKLASPPPSPDAIASTQYSSLSDGSTSSDYPTPHLTVGCVSFRLFVVVGQPTRQRLVRLPTFRRRRMGRCLRPIFRHRTGRCVRTIAYRRGSTSTHSSSATVTVPKSDKFFNKDMVRKLKRFLRA